MYKISQKELLSEGFWDKFSNSPIVRKVAKAASVAGSIANIIAPEFTNPINKGRDWLKNTKEKANRAGMTRDQISLEYIKEDGFFPNPKDATIRWNNKRNADGTFNGTIRVGELENDETTGEPKLGRTYAPDKSTYILKFDPATRTAKRVRGPDRNLSTGYDEIRYAIQNLNYTVMSSLKPVTTQRNGNLTGLATLKDSAGVTKRYSYEYDPNTDIATVTPI